jgi:L,D-transpeptidase ErfK/SrfK
MNASVFILVLVFQLVGGEFQHTVKAGESLTSIGALYGVDARVIAEQNKLAAAARIHAGQVLAVNNRHIIPSGTGAEIVINIPQRMLFHFGKGITHMYPIAAGQPSWRTPLGPFTVLTMEMNPIWDVPLSIQDEMRAEGRPVLTKVLPGPNNPLGEYWIGTSFPGIGIHGTNAPASIYSLQTHGCIRLHPENIGDLFERVQIGATGRIVYEPVLLTVVDGVVYLEVHADPYGKGAQPLDVARNLARNAGLEESADWTEVMRVVRKHEGVARAVVRILHR